MAKFDRPPLGTQTFEIKDAATYLGVSEATVRRLIADGDLRGVRIRGSLFVTRDSVQLYRAEQEATPPYDEGLQERVTQNRRERNAQLPTTVSSQGSLLGGD